VQVDPGFKVSLSAMATLYFAQLYMLTPARLLNTILHLGGSIRLYYLFLLRNLMMQSWWYY